MTISLLGGSTPFLPFLYVLTPGPLLKTRQFDEKEGYNRKTVENSSEIAG